MRISRAAFDKIIAWEVGSRAQYERLYRRPERPGGASGITIGIGYDLGYSTRAQFRSDWAGLIPDEMIDALLLCVGVTGAEAQRKLSSVRSKVDVPWSAAMAVYEKKDIPKWENIVIKALPNTDKLAPDSFGALVSLAYNRGPSFGKAGDRYSEMRAIKRHMVNEDFDQVPAEIRAMKRIWRGDPAMRGLLSRRDAEAALFEKGLRGAEPSPRLVPEPSPPLGPVTSPPLAPSVPTSSEPPPRVDVSAVVFDPLLKEVQQRLRDLGYTDVGEPDGKLGPRTKDAIVVFRRNNGLPMSEEIDDEFLATLMKATKRPVTIERAETKAPDLAPKNDAVWQTGWQKFGAKVVAAFTTAGAFLSMIYDWLKDNVTDLTKVVEPIRGVLSSVPTTAWWLIAAALAVLIGYSAHRAQNKLVDDYQRGKLMS